MRNKIIEWLVIISIVATLAALILPSVRDARNDKEPHGEMLPVDPPLEAN